MDKLEELLKMVDMGVIGKKTFERIVETEEYKYYKVRSGIYEEI